MGLLNPERKVDGEPSILLAKAARLVLCFILISAALVIAVYFYYRFEVNRIREAKASELSAIGQMKVSQIQWWREERGADARRLAEAPAFKKLVAEWLADPQRRVKQEYLTESLQLEESLGIYFQALLVSTDGKVLLSVRQNSAEMEAESWLAVEEALKKHAPVLSRLHESGSGRIHVDIAEALWDDEGRPLAVVVLSTDAENYLFPMIKFWPTLSKSGETLLVRKEGEEVLYLNELRHRKGAALKLRFPLVKTELPSVQAVSGQRGIFAGRDYRGEKVVSDLRPVPGTGWFLVTKENESEMLAEARFHFLAASLVVLLLLLCITAGMMIWHKTYQIEERKRAEQELRESLARFDGFSAATQYGFGMADLKGNIVYANKALCRLLGESDPEACLGKNFLKTYYSPEMKAKLQNEVLPRALQTGGWRGELELATIDGRYVPVEENYFVIPDEEGRPRYLADILTDITDRKRTEKLLLESETKFHTLFDEAMDGILLADPNTQQLSIPNPRMCRMLGYSAEELGKMKVPDLHPSRDRPHVMEMFQQMLRGEIPMAPAVPMLRKDGSVLYADVSGKIVELAGKQRVFGIFRDVTEYQRLVTELAQARETQFRTLIESLPQKVYLKDPDSVYLACNKSYAKALGIRPEEIVGKTDRDLFGETFYERSREDDIRIMTSRKAEGREEESALEVAAGSGFLKAHVHIIKAPVMDSAGKVKGLFGLIWDITERKEKEEQLRKSRDLLAKVAARVPGVIYQFYARPDGSKGFYFVSERSEQLFGIKADPSTFFGDFSSRVIPEQRADFLKSIDDVVREVHEWNYEGVMEKPTGEKVCFFASSSPTVGEKEIVFNGLITDITERKQLAEEKKMLGALKAVSETKAKFATMVSHELRSPLAVITESLDIVLEGLSGEVTDEQKDVLCTAKRSVDRLGRLINNVLDFRKIEAGKLDYDFRENDLNATLAEAIEGMYILARRKGLVFRTELDEGLPKFLFDNDRILQVIMNLVTNAIRSTEHGSVILSTRHEEGAAHVTVRDTGKGISVEGMNKLFMPFEKVNGLRAPSHGGSGLGLAISKELVLGHQGKIWAESKEGQGSTFHFTLPIRVPAVAGTGGGG